MYQSTALVEITLRIDTNQTDISTSEQLVRTEAKLAISDTILSEAALHYPGLTADQLAREVTTAPKMDGVVMIVDITNANKEDQGKSMQNGHLLSVPATPRLSIPGAGEEWV